MADIPGLIEGASEGVGLGHEFLRHVDRCRMLIHVVDVSGSEGRDPVGDFEAINRELSVYSPELSSRPQIVAANKCDLATPEQLEALTEYLRQKDIPCFPLTAPIAEGTDKLINFTAAMLDKLPPVKRYEPEPAPEPAQPEGGARAFEIKVENGVYEIVAPWVERILRDVNPDDYESLQYFQRALASSGIIAALKAAGVQDGDTVRAGGMEFDYVD